MTLAKASLEAVPLTSRVLACFVWTRVYGTPNKVVGRFLVFPGHLEQPSNARPQVSRIEKKALSFQ